MRYTFPHVWLDLVRVILLGSKPYPLGKRVEEPAMCETAQADRILGSGREHSMS